MLSLCTIIFALFVHYSVEVTFMQYLVRESWLSQDSECDLADFVSILSRIFNAMVIGEMKIAILLLSRHENFHVKLYILLLFTLYYQS